MSSSKAFFISQIIVSLSSFFRNLVLARILGAESFGIASTYAIVLSLVEITSQIGIDKFVVYYKYSTNRRVISSCHTISVLRGLLLSILLFVSAGIFARMFDTQEYLLSYQILAVVPFIRGLANLEFAVDQKSKSFYRISFMDAIPQLVANVSVVVLALLYPSPDIMVACFFIINAGYTLISHWKASTPFRLMFDYVLFRKVLVFSIPLLVSGIITFSIIQGDKFIVGVFYSAEQLGIYIATFSLLNIPVLFLLRFVSTIFLPSLSAVKDSEQKLNFVRSCLVLAFVVSLLYATLIQSVVSVVFGKEYVSSFQLGVAIALVNALWIARGTMGVVFLSEGRTKILMHANILRGVGLVFAIYFGFYNHSLIYVPLSGAIGELWF